MPVLKRAWAEISLDAIKQNFKTAKNAVAPGVRIMSVVKADAYGHGDAEVARALSAAGTDWFAVSNLDEALRLREAGIEEPVLILGYTPPEYAGTLAQSNISQTVFGANYARELSREAVKSGVTVNIHIKIDTGMTRLGFVYHDSADEDAVSSVFEACALPGLFPEGIFTHFARADEAEGEAFTRLQYGLFTDILNKLSAKSLSFPLRHCCNSAAILNYPEMALDMVRPGIMLYGLAPCAKFGGILCPAMEIKTVIALQKTVPPGTPISYGGTFVTQRETVLATVPLGYADGYPRSLGGRACMEVAGARAPIAGRVCMDQTVLDVTGIPETREGMTVSAVGGGVTLDELASLAGTINYELCCAVSKRVPRVYK